MSASLYKKVLYLTNQKLLADGSVLKKIKKFSSQGVERDIYRWLEIAKVIPRLNICHDP